MTAPEVAWKVTLEMDEGYLSTVVFAQNEEEARTDGVYELDGCAEPDGAEVGRAPEYDQYTDPTELTRAMLANGWQFYCRVCGRDLTYDDCEEDDEGNPLLEPTIVVRHGAVYCSSRCCLAKLREQRSFRENEWKVVADAVARWPGIEIVSSNGLAFGLHECRNAVVGRVEFRFPGGLGLVSWHRYSPTVDVELRDAAAWAAFTGIAWTASP